MRYHVFHDLLGKDKPLGMFDDLSYAHNWAGDMTANASDRGFQDVYGVWDSAEGREIPFEESQPLVEYPYTVGVFMIDRAYGGSEEGGWYYDTGELVRPIKRRFRDEDSACAYARRMNHLLGLTLNKGRRDISSVLSEGAYAAEVHEGLCPKYYPQQRPHYE